MLFHKTVLHAWAILHTLFNCQFTQYYVLYADRVGNVFFITDPIHIPVILPRFQRNNQTIYVFIRYLDVLLPLEIDKRLFCLIDIHSR